jgi:hypothetical protein
MPEQSHSMQPHVNLMFLGSSSHCRKATNIANRGGQQVSATSTDSAGKPMEFTSFPGLPGTQMGAPEYFEQALWVSDASRFHGEGMTEEDFRTHTHTQTQARVGLGVVGTSITYVRRGRTRACGLSYLDVIGRAHVVLCSPVRFFCCAWV